MCVKGAIVAALGVLLAVPAATRATGLQQRAEEEARRKLEENRARAQQSEKGTPAPLDDAQRRAVAEVLSRSQLAGQAGALAASRAKASDVKKLGKSLADDERQVSENVGKLLQQRGTAPGSLPQDADRARIEGELGALAKASGDGFDRAFVEFLARNVPPYKEAAGRARDATPGSDADLKWYLDQVERLEIAHRDAARRLSAQREARSPPPQVRRPAGR